MKRKKKKLSRADKSSRQGELRQRHVEHLQRKLDDLWKRFGLIIKAETASWTEAEQKRLTEMLTQLPPTPKDLTEEQLKIIVEKMKAAAAAEGKKP